VVYRREMKRKEESKRGKRVERRVRGGAVGERVQE
jgi:hypothetical protein